MPSLCAKWSTHKHEVELLKHLNHIRGGDPNVRVIPVHDFLPGLNDGTWIIMPQYTPLRSISLTLLTYKQLRYQVFEVCRLHWHIIIHR